MNKLNRRIIFMAVFFLLSACERAVNGHKTVSYLIHGEKQGVLYPLEVRQHSEDVLIQLKESAPVPDILSVDAKGRVVPFSFTTEGTMLVVPGKFDHLRLRHDGVGTVDIIRQEIAKPSTN
ncbi:hypothetical protein [Undibacterium sp.]|uniref:hypothetical protein n=1 Tax=Undibacterium sp. TaxID=1914977 RepID=UPI00272CB2E5|nr:hypothetical protein [Undibacterium sp.]